jgi:TATA-binding protein-associated factor Taf7
MSRSDRPAPEALPEESFGVRWSRLKREESREPVAGAEVEAAVEAESPPLTDADMPPVESLTETSDFSGFMSSGVSESLRRVALRKLFSGAQFNLRDGLDDYDDDFTSFAKLAEIVTADMRHQLQRQAEKERAEAQAQDHEAVAEPAVDETPQQPESAPPIPETTLEAAANEEPVEEDEPNGINV